MQRLIAALKAQDRTILVNSSFLMGTTVMGSLLGFVFWAAASRLYTPAEFGLGTAYISALLFLSNVGDMGLGTALIRFLPSLGTRRNLFINSSIITIAAVTLILTVVFTIGVSLWSPILTGFVHSGAGLALFVGAALSLTLAQFMDTLYIALQVTQWLFVRNLCMHIVRLILLVTICRSFGAVGMFLAVGTGVAVSFGLSVGKLAPRALPGYGLRLDFSGALVKEKIRYALGNYVALLLWNIPPVLYPLVVANILGAVATAHFYTSWMVVNLLFMVPNAVSTAAFARAASATESQAKTYWRTMWVTVLGMAPASLGLIAVSQPILRLFGERYATEPRLLALLALSIIPYTINSFVITAFRLRRNVNSVIVVSGIIATLALSLVAMLAMVQGTDGIGVGWIIAQVLGVLVCYVSYRFNPRLLETPVSIEVGDVKANSY
jgi:O-antigen/teichoic acid export membrane protein